MFDPLVSVIIPVFNNEKSIQEAILSVLNQTYSPIEIIIIDNGSQDKSLELAQALTKDWKNIENKAIRNVQFLRIEHQELFNAINHGLKHASGNYLTTLLPTDYYHSERIEKLVHKVVKANLHLAFTRVIGLGLNNQTLPFDNPWKIRYEKSMYNIIEFPTLETNFLNEDMSVSPGNLFFSKQLFETIRGFRNFKILFSLDFILRAIPYFEISFINESLYYLRINKRDEWIEEPDLYKEELKQLRLDYFLNMNAIQRINLNAPSQKEWFNRLYIAKYKLHLSDLLEQLVQKPNSNISEEENCENVPLPSRFNEKITLVTQNLSIGGGATKLLLDLSKGLLAAGYSPSIISFNDGPMRAEFEKFKIPVHIVPSILKWNEKKGRIKKGVSLLLLILYSHFKTSRKIIVNSASSHLFALPFALFSKFKDLTWYIHESFSPIVYLKSDVEKSLMKKAIDNNTFSFWFGSESTKNIWHSALGVSGKVFHWSGIKSKNSSLSMPKPIKNLLAVGTVNIRKGTHHLVDGFIHCIKNQMIAEDVILTIVGFPQQIDLICGNIILKVFANHLQSRIKLISCTSEKEMNGYYEKTDLFLQTSLLECLPLSLLKAMADGIPVISTDVNGCAEAICHGESGYLCRPSSSLALADTISEAIANFEKTHAMAKNAQKIFNEKFCLDITMDAIIKEISFNQKGC